MNADIIDIGFTGTRKGMSLAQKDQLVNILRYYCSIRKVNFRHGACCGADIEADQIARNLGCKMFIQPSNHVKTRVHCEEPDDIVFPEKPPLIRDKDIVWNCMTLLAAPKSNKEELRSGTWTTVRYARKLNKDIVMLIR